MTKVIFVGVTLGGAFAAALALLYQHENRQLSGIRAEVAALRSAADRPPEPVAPWLNRFEAPELAALARAATPSGPGPAGDGGSASPSPPPPPRSSFEIRNSLEARFTTEARDGAWSGGAQRTLETKLRGVMPEGSSVRAIECRESMCRIETEHASYDSVRNFIRGAFMDPSTMVWGAGFASHAEPPTRAGDPVRAVAFLAREGAALDLAE